MPNVCVLYLKASAMERRGILERMDESPLFGEKMKLAHKAAMANRWEDFKKIMIEDKENLLEWFDLFGNTSIHIATRSNNPQLLKELIETALEEHSWPDLCKKNREGNTVLHEVAFCKNDVVQMANVVLEFEKNLPPHSSSLEENMPLWEVKNHQGETPLYMAAKYGKLNLVKLLANHIGTHNMENIRNHLHRSDNYTALHASVIGQHFDVAIWLARMDKELAMEKDNKGFTSLQLLCNMPLVFRSQTHIGPMKRLIYQLLPDDGHEVEDGEKDEKDLKSDKMGESKLPKSVISKINYGFWKRLAKEFDGIDHMWKQKKKHMLAECLANILVQYDLSWQISHNDNKRITLVTLPHLPFNVAKRRRLIEHRRQEGRKNPKETLQNRTPLLSAAKTGIVEIVEKILDVNPEAISHITDNGQNILNMAIKYRQQKIIQIIKRKNALESLARQITDKGRTLLHEVARIDYYKAGHLAGVAFQLQDELHWYDKVRRMVPQHYNMHCDKEGQTPDDLLEIEHDEMLKNAQKWLKETAQSCSTVAVLVATVVFAAAYAIPGGTERGTPVLLHAHLFLFFTVMDIVALATSLASVVMFLSILTSPCELWDFHKSLPRKLNLGFALLFISLMTTMLAFSATILLVIRLEWKNWTSSLIYSAAFFPVTVFAVIQFPVYVMATSTSKQFWKLLKIILPKRLTRSVKNVFVKKYIN